MIKRLVPSTAWIAVGLSLSAFTDLHSLSNVCSLFATFLSYETVTSCKDWSKKRTGFQVRLIFLETQRIPYQCPLFVFFAVFDKWADLNQLNNIIIVGYLIYFVTLHSAMPIPFSKMQFSDHCQMPSVHQTNGSAIHSRPGLVVRVYQQSSSHCVS